MHTKQVTRIAPSPTGKIHIGTLKSAIFTWLWSLQNNAEFILRIDDTDSARSKDEYINHIHDFLRSYKIVPNKIFKQSDRNILYVEVLQKCIDAGFAYPVYDSEEELKERKSPYKRANAKFGTGECYYRFDIGNDVIKFLDAIRGPISICLKGISDPVICKPNGEFTYSFASIVDDLTEGVTMIIRGSDHIDNTATQICMMNKMIEHNIFDDHEIKFGHYPLFVLNNEKISKRKASELALLETFHPMALANYITLVGTNKFGKEYYSNLAELATVFNLKSNGGSNTVNIDLNHLYKYQRKAFSNMNAADVCKWAKVHLTEDQWNLIKDDALTLEDIRYWERVFNDCALYFATAIDKSDDKIFLRYAITGQKRGPNMNEILKIMDPDLVKKRLEKCQSIQIQMLNSITGQLETFIPIDSRSVRMYCCGPTLYDRPHIGNLRCLVTFDIVFRFLQLFYIVKYVRNITDIDDKIVNKATELNIAPEEVVKQAYKAFLSDQAYLKIMPPTIETMATDYIKPIIDLIQKMIDSGHAYQRQDGVYFNINSIEDYDCFNTKREMSVTDDFALWRCKDDYGWDSPWGKGRPGWHMECTAMSIDKLGAPFDIHCGGKDLIFPHHTNECAQAAGLGYPSVAKYWLHNEFINIDNAKMSKSLNNQANITYNIPSGVIRIAFLRSHYRDPLHWTDALIVEANALYHKWRRSIGTYLIIKRKTWPLHRYGAPIASFVTVLASDFNTPLAISIINKELEHIRDLYHLTDILASFHLIGVEFNLSYINRTDIIDLIEERNAAKKAKHFARADEIRNILQNKNIELQDSPHGTIWYEK